LVTIAAPSANCRSSSTTGCQRAAANLAAIAHTRAISIAEEPSARSPRSGVCGSLNTLGAVWRAQASGRCGGAAARAAATNARTLANLALAFDLSGRAADAADARRRACAIDRQHCS
jgi:hypothetical protein